MSLRPPGRIRPHGELLSPSFWLPALRRFLWRQLCQRTRSAYIYGAICPAEGKGAGLVHPRCNTEGMTLHLAEISAAVAPGAHAVLLLDQAGWHGSRALVVPGNITLMPLPPQCPEVNPVVWRRVVLPVATSLATLQRIVQLCMGWQNGDGAVERFRLHGEYPSGLSPLSGFALWPGERFGYDYGGWRCQIRLEKLVAAPSHGYPVCIAGQRSRPARATRQRLGVYDISAQVSLGV